MGRQTGVTGHPSDPSYRSYSSRTIGRAAGARPVVVALAFLLAFFGPFPARAAQSPDEVELSREGLASIQLAQQWLAAQQRADGSFSGALGDGSGIVASAALAWMASGNLPGEGPYGKNVARAVEYILSNQQTTGLLFRGRDERKVMYQHGLATLCLAEAWGQTLDPRVEEKLRQAVDLITRCQNERGGWRYQPQAADDDLSVTVMQLIALRAARDAGVAVPKETISRAVRYVESCRSPQDQETGRYSGFSYLPNQERQWSTTAAGLMSLMLCGDYRAAKLREGLDYLMEVRERKEDRRWFVYGNYYAAQALYQAGNQNEKFNRYWLKWYPGMARTLIAQQTRTGPNRGRFEYDPEYGVWSTAMCVLILGLPYRYLPIYQR